MEPKEITDLIREEEIRHTKALQQALQIVQDEINQHKQVMCNITLGTTSEPKRLTQNQVDDLAIIKKVRADYIKACQDHPSNKRIDIIGRLSDKWRVSEETIKRYLRAEAKCAQFVGLKPLPCPRKIRMLNIME